MLYALSDGPYCDGLPHLPGSPRKSPGRSLEAFWPTATAPVGHREFLVVDDKLLHPSEQAILASDRKTTPNQGPRSRYGNAPYPRERLDNGSFVDKGIYELSDIFSDVPEALYFDWARETLMDYSVCTTSQY